MSNKLLVHGRLSLMFGAGLGHDAVHTIIVRDDRLNRKMSGSAPEARYPI